MRLLMARKVLAFKTIVADDLRLEAGTVIPAGSMFPFFTDYDSVNDEPVTGVHESEILKHLFQSSARRLILHELGVTTDARIYFDVRSPVVQQGEKPGDIDVVICPNARADIAIGLQCKRVKIEALSQDEDRVNKLPDIRAAVKQTNLQRANFGFHKNYLVIVIQGYGKLRTNSNVVFRGPTSETFKQVYEFPQRESLHGDAGVLFIQIIQPTGKTYRRMYEIGVCLDKEAKPLVQTAKLTNRIKEMMQI